MLAAVTLQTEGWFGFCMTYVLLWLNERKSMKTVGPAHGTRTRRAIFHVAPGASVPTLVNDSADILRVRTPSIIMPIYYDYYPVIADTPTTPVTSRFANGCSSMSFALPAVYGISTWKENHSDHYSHRLALMVEWFRLLHRDMRCKLWASWSGCFIVRSYCVRGNVKCRWRFPSEGLTAAFHNFSSYL